MHSRIHVDVKCFHVSTYENESCQLRGSVAVATGACPTPPEESRGETPGMIAEVPAVSKLAAAVGKTTLVPDTSVTP